MAVEVERRLRSESWLPLTLSQLLHLGDGRRDDKGGGVNQYVSANGIRLQLQLRHRL